MFRKCDTSAPPVAGAVAQLHLAHDTVDIAAEIIVRQTPELMHRHPHIAAVARATAELRHGTARIFKAGTCLHFFGARPALATNDNLIDAAHAVGAQHV
jgi:hypothetical protein